MKQEEAIKLARNYLRINHPEHDIAEATLSEHETCYSVSYASRKFLATNYSGFMTFGSGPLLIEKGTSIIYETGSAHTADYYANALARGGSPFAFPTNRISVSEYSPEVKRDFIQLLRKYFGLPVSECTDAVDKLSKEGVIELSCDAVETCAELVDTIRYIGISATQVWNTDKPADYLSCKPSDSKHPHNQQNHPIPEPPDLVFSQEEYELLKQVTSQKPHLPSGIQIIPGRDSST